MMFSSAIFLVLYVTSSQCFLFNFGKEDPFEDNFITFELYTRENNDTYSSGTGQPIGMHLKSVRDSNFNANRPTKLFLHGWFGAGWNWYIRDMRREMLKQVDCNFIEADWSKGSVNVNYIKAKQNAQRAGKESADFIVWLHDQFGLQYKDVHVIGHSLGGQAAGALGAAIQNPKIGRISGLDPAQPGFNLTDPADTLGAEDAEFVDNIHTTLVSTEPMGHVDFYPNGGDLGILVVTWVHSHLQSIYLYTETINSKCDFTAYKCQSYQNLQDGLCPTYCGSSTDYCNKMGYHASSRAGTGVLQLHIDESYPYC